MNVVRIILGDGTSRYFTPADPQQWHAEAKAYVLKYYPGRVVKIEEVEVKTTRTKLIHRRKRT